MEYISQPSLSMQELSKLSEEDLVNREENIESEINYFEGECDSYGKKIEILEDKLFKTNDQAKKTELQDEMSHFRDALSIAQARLLFVEQQLDNIHKVRESRRNFHKRLFLKNVRELIKGGGIKLGQIEKDAGCQPGYVSRLEKESNSSDPSAEFIATASKHIGISMDTLNSIDFCCLTPTQKYEVSFFEKLISDSNADKLDWQRENKDILNRMETDMNGDTDHPLFSFKRFTIKNEDGFSQEEKRVVFVSDSFGLQTYIANDCFRLRLKNGSCLYLMDIERAVHKVGDISAYAKEIWIFTPGAGSHILARNNDNTQLASLVDRVFATVQGHMKLPKIKNAHKQAIDAFMKDDFEDDPANPNR